MRWLFWKKRSVPVPVEIIRADGVDCPGCDYHYEIPRPRWAEVTVVCMECGIQFDIIPNKTGFNIYVRTL